MREGGKQSSCGPYRSDVTDDLSDTLLELPVWAEDPQEELDDGKGWAKGGSYLDHSLHWDLTTAIWRGEWGATLLFETGHKIRYDRWSKEGRAVDLKVMDYTYLLTIIVSTYNTSAKLGPSQTENSSHKTSFRCVSYLHRDLLSTIYTASNASLFFWSIGRMSISMGVPGQKGGGDWNAIPHQYNPGMFESS